jgi:hypothetical protein
MEAFLVEADKVAKEVLTEGPIATNKSFFVELKLIKEMSGRLTGKKIDTRWSNLLGGINWTPENISENDVYIQSHRHSYSSIYADLYEY